MAVSQTLDLTAEVSLTDSAEGEKYVVGNELGLTARFVANVCDPVAKALSVTSEGHVRFGDIQAVKLGPTSFPGVTLLGLGSENTSLLALVELKPFWTFTLEQYPILSSLAVRRPLEPSMGMFFRSTYHELQRHHSPCMRMKGP